MKIGKKSPIRNHQLLSGMSKEEHAIWHEQHSTIEESPEFKEKKEEKKKEKKKNVVGTRKNPIIGIYHPEEIPTMQHRDDISYRYRYLPGRFTDDDETILENLENSYYQDKESGSLYRFKDGEYKLIEGNPVDFKMKIDGKNINFLNLHEGAINYDGFRFLATDRPDGVQDVSQYSSWSILGVGGGVEEYLRNTLNAVHKNFEKQNTYPSWDKGTTFEFDYKAWTGADELVIERLLNGEKQDEIVIKLPTEYSEDKYNQMQKAYEKYLAFINPTAESEYIREHLLEEHVNPVDFHSGLYSRNALPVTVDGVTRLEGFNDFLLRVAPNENEEVIYDFEEKVGGLGGFYSTTLFVAPGNERGGIQRVQNSFLSQPGLGWGAGQGHMGMQPTTAILGRRNYLYQLSEGHPDYMTDARPIGEIIDRGHVMGGDFSEIDDVKKGVINGVEFYYRPETGFDPEKHYAQFVEYKYLTKKAEKARRLNDASFYKAIDQKNDDDIKLEEKNNIRSNDPDLVETIEVISELAAEDPTKKEMIELGVGLIQEERKLRANVDVETYFEAEGQYLTYEEVGNYYLNKTQDDEVIDQLNEDYVDSFDEELANFTEKFEDGLKRLLEDNKEKLDKQTIEELSKTDASDNLEEVNKLISDWENNAEKLGKKIVEAEYFNFPRNKFKGTDEEYHEEIVRRSQIKFEEYQSIENEKAQALQDEYWSVYNTIFEEKFSVLSESYAEAETAKLTTQFEKGFANFHAQHINQVIGKTLSIPQGTYQKTWQVLRDQDFHMQSYKNKKSMIDNEWLKLEKIFDLTYDELEVDELRREFYLHTYQQVSFDKDFQPNEFAIRGWAHQKVRELKAFEKEREKLGLELSEEDELTLKQVTKILETPEAVHGSGAWNLVKNYFDGVTRYSITEWIPIYSDWVAGTDMKLIQNISQKKSKLKVGGEWVDSETREVIPSSQYGNYRSSNEDKVLKSYLMLQQIEEECSKQSNAYNAGSSSKEMFKFIIEMAVSRGLGKLISGGAGLTRMTKINLGSKFVTKPQKVINRWMKARNMTKLPTSVNIRDKAAATLGFLLDTSMMTSTVGIGRTRSKYWENMTPEMTYVWSTVDGVDNGLEMVNSIDVLGYPIKDANGNVYGHEDWIPTYDKTRDPFEAYFNAWSHSWVDYSTEKFGRVFSGKKYLPKEMIDNPTWFKRTLVGKLMNKLNLAPGQENDLLEWVRRNGSWDGVIGEFAEELLAEPGHNILDGRPMFMGMDRDWFETTAIAVIGGQFTMSTAGRVKRAIGKQIGGDKFPPSYKITLENGDVFQFDNIQDALGAIESLKEEGLINAKTEIEINNDYEASEAAEQFVGADLAGIVKSSNFGDVLEDAVAANDITIIGQISDEVRKIVIDLRNEQERIQKEIANIFRTEYKSEEQLDQAKNRVLNLKNKLKNVKGDINNILDPIMDQVNELRETPLYKKLLKNVLKIAAKIDPNLTILEMDSNLEVEEFIRQYNINNYLRKNYGIQTFINAETGKRVFIDAETNQEISKENLAMLEMQNAKGDIVPFSMRELENLVDAVDIDPKTGELIDMGADLTHGFFAEVIGSDGKSTIVINKGATFTFGADSVVAHEFLHRFLRKTFNNNPHTKLAIGNTLKEYLLDINPKGIRNSKFRQKLFAYQQHQGEEASAEETLTLFSDALLKGEIKFEETMMTRIGDMIRRAFQAVGYRVEFTDGRSVWNFIRDYNKAAETGRMSKGLERTFEEGAKIGGIIQARSDAYAEHLRRNFGLTQNEDGTFDVSDDIKFSKSIYEDEELFTPEMLVEIIKSPSSKEIEVRGATEALTNQFDLLALSAINYDTRKGDIARENVISAARVELPGIIKRFDPTTSKFSTYVTNTMRPKAQQIYEEAKNMAFEMTSLDSPLVQELADTTVETKKDTGKIKPKINVLQFDKVSDKVNNITNIVDPVKEGDTFKEVTDKYTGKIAKEVFDVPSIKITDPAKNLTYAKNIVHAEDWNWVDKDGKINEKKSAKAGDKITQAQFNHDKDLAGVPEASEAGNIQDFYAGDNMGKTIRILPEFNVTSEDADINKIGENIDVSRDVYGRGIGLKNRVLKYFYDPVIDPVTGKQKRSKGKTSQVPIWQLKPEFKNPTEQTIQKAREEAGITPRGELNNYNRTIGQFLKGLAYFQAQTTALSAAQRSLETKAKLSPKEKQKAIKQQIANITTAQGKIAFSFEYFPNQETYETELDISQINIEFEMSERGNANKLLNIHIDEGMYRHRTKEEIDGYFDAVKEIMIPTFSKKFFGGLPSFLFPSKRILPKYKGKGGAAIIKDENGKDVSIADYFKRKRDKLFEGELNYGTELKGEGAKYSYGPTYAQKFGEGKKDIGKAFNDGTRETWNDIHLSMHEQMWQRIVKTLRDPITGKINKTAVKVWGNYLSLAGNNTKHPHRMGAEWIGYSINPKGYKPGPKAKFKFYEWEHAMMATKSYLYLLDAALSGYDFNTAYAIVQENYKLIALDNYHDKVQIAESGRSKTMGRVWNSETNSWGAWNLIQHSFLDRYFHPDIVAVIDPNTGKPSGGIPPSSIMGPDNKTFAKIYNINADGSPRGTILGIQNKFKYSKAINNSRAINENTESRGVSVWDFDDTLATTKSGVRATVPNLDGTPQPSRKVIFLAGGAGSGKGNVVSKLELEKQGFKIVNQDISLEWLKKNHGLPENMNDLTKEQRSTLGKLGHQARKIAKDKMMKYQGNAEGIVVDGTGGSLKAMQKLVDEFMNKGYDISMLFVETSLETALERNRARKERSLLDKIVIRNHEAVQGNKDGFKEMFGERFMEVKTDNLKQEDPMPDTLVSAIDNFVSSYKKIRLDAEEFATQGSDILAQGGKFDFSEFSVVTEGAIGPMFNTALNRAKKYGTKDTYILTARPPESEGPIHEFLKSQGLDIPLENITGLGNSTGDAKAEWILEKYSEGYNNIFFADDAMQNVEAVRHVLDQLDIKSKVVQAKMKFSKEANSTIDEILTDPKIFKSKQQISLNNVNNVNGLINDGVYSNIKFSKKHRGEYENLISKNRPDLVREGLVSQTVDAMFNYVDNLSVPADKKRKYEKITTKWLATSNIKLNEDAFKIKDAVELAEKHKEDIFSYNNPNEIIEKYAGKSKAKPTDPNNVKEFGESQVLNKEYGLTVHEVEDTKEGMMSVRKVVDTHWGPESNPWCIIARSEKQRLEPRQYGYELATTKREAEARKKQLESEGFIVSIRDRGQNIKDKKEFQYELDIKEMSEGPGIMDDAWQNWTVYDKSKKYVVFQNGKLLSFYANDQYWDRMDNPTDAPVITEKEGNVTEKVELVPVGVGKVQEFVMERRTVSKDKKTVTTEYFAETKDYLEGTKIIEDRVNGQTVKETEYRSEDKGGTIYRETTFKNGKAVETRTLNHKGRTSSVNNGLGDMSAKEVVPNFGDLIAHEITEGNTDHWFGKIHLKSQGIKGVDGITEIGFSTRVGEFELMDVMKRVDGKLRLDLDKVAKVDVETGIMGLPKGIRFSKEFDLNQILEESMNVNAKKVFSDAQARIRGGKFRFRGLIPPSAQDFMGLLYNFAGKGKQGEKHLEILKKALIDPFARGYNELNTSRQRTAEDYRNLLKEYPDVKKDLNKTLNKIAETYEGFDRYEGVEFTIDQAVRVYLWNKAGFEITGLSKRDLKLLTSFVENDSELQTFADALGIMSGKVDGYSKPGEYWLTENIASDLMSDGALGDKRVEVLAEWIENKNMIFSPENLNKIEAIYGTNFRQALEDVLYRMETGSNRPTGRNRLTNMYLNWVNNSVGAIMFFNIRSSVLQTISATNYINWTDNNPLEAAKAFANQKQYWSDFAMIFNSDMLRQRRAGLRYNVNEAELAAAIALSDNKAKAVIGWLLKKGFTPTQIADSFAIASGGASFYRNRVNSYIKDGMSRAKAEQKAWLDFQETTEVAQQSARPDLISQQQSNPLGRLILAFANTPMQYGRIMNKAFRDLYNKRGDAKTHISKILYYGFIQAAIFTALQQALFAVIGTDDDEEKEKMLDNKLNRMANSMLDTWLTTFGYGGKAVSTVKNTIMEYNKQRAKDLDESFMTRSDHAYTLLQALSFSPPIGSKMRKIYQSIQTEKWNRDLIKERGFTLDNPAWSMIGNTVEGVTNVPLGRMSNKALNVDNAMDSQHETWQRIALLMGWNTWDLGIKDPDLVALGEEIKERKKQEKKMEREKKKYEEKRDKLEEKYPDKTPEEIDSALKSKELFVLNKKEQIDLLKKLGVSNEEIKNLKKEKDRTDKITEFYKDNTKLINNAIKTSKSKPKKEKEEEKIELSKFEKRKKDLIKMKKQEQINILLELGYSSRDMYLLKYENDRVNKILELEKKKSK